MNRRVLIVDDSQFARGLARAFLTDVWADAEVLEAADALEALRLCAGNPPQHIIADLNMPGMTGLELIETLRARGVAATATLVTADIQHDVRRRAEDAKARFIEKPITREKMQRLLEDLDGGLLAYLSGEERDAFCEIFNMGAGRAAKSLSELLGQEIKTSVPGITMLGVDEAKAYIEARLRDNVSLIKEHFSGPFDGVALLMFSQASARRLTDSLLTEHTMNIELEALHDDALSEVGNVVINACLASFASLLDSVIHKSLPEVIHTTSDGMLQMGRRFGVVVIVRVGFAVAGQGIEGLTSFLLGLESMEAFRQATNRLLGREPS